MFFPDVFDAEVIHDEDEYDWTPLVSPQARGGCTLEVPMFRQALSEEVVGEFARLFETVDTFGDFEVYPAVVDVLHEVVFVDELLGYVFDADTRVFGAVQWCSQVIVGDVGTEEFGAWSRADTVEDSFDYFDCPCFGAAITSVCDGVATDGDAGSVGVFFAKFHVTDDTNVSNVF
jgi:hypothetical protein